ncbi:MAG: cytochrome c oxidase subunit II [Dehalococcoidia bacterium]|nr:cytochrome c oxidase subunit II [Dehalococcoidia bacterium]MSQ16425.1 cytochrome c oxidase subunit II [Dehalococcoidia bacterium]
MGFLPFRSRNVTDGTPGSFRQVSRPGLSRVPPLALLAAMAVLALLVACSPQSNMSTWETFGPVARGQLHLFNVLLWVMVVVFVLVEGILLYAIIRYRRRPGQPLPHQTHGNMPLEIAWTIIPTILVLAVGGWSVATLFRLDQPPASAGKPLEVVVTGHQWWWEFEYPDADGAGKVISTANELRVPVNRPINITLHSDDVIHSFWVPKLAGKMDVIPTRSNKMWFQADATGTYYGQCAELCGVIHALMKFRVQVLTNAEYDTWVAGYGKAPQLSADALKGQAVFQGAGTCTVCHTASGVDNPAVVDGRVAGFNSGGAIAPGPNLTDLATRTSFAAGTVEPLNPDNLRKWINNPNDLKPSTHMAGRAKALYPDGSTKVTLSDVQVSDLVAYLMSLK